MIQVREKREITVASTHSPYGLAIIESCTSCSYRKEGFFCDLAPATVQRLSTITFTSCYPKGATLFVEGQPSRGVFILCTGRAKLSTSSIDGKTLIARLANHGEVLGLPATVTGSSYELTAEIIEPAQTKFISRVDLLNFLRESGDVALHVAQQLGATYHAAVAEMRTIGLSHSAGERLAGFLLDMTTDQRAQKGIASVRLTFTQQEIAQMIGTSRETVTRLFAEFRKKDLLTVRGSMLTITNRPGLERILRG
jgi:CRP/FNR family transcriptional regulator, cyclic AMP receptor protein